MFLCSAQYSLLLHSIAWWWWWWEEKEEHGNDDNDDDDDDDEEEEEEEEEGNLDGKAEWCIMSYTGTSRARSSSHCNALLVIIRMVMIAKIFGKNQNSIYRFEKQRTFCHLNILPHFYIELKRWNWPSQGILCTFLGIIYSNSSHCWFQHSYNLFVGSFYDDLLFDPAGLLFSNRTNKVGKLGGIIRRMNGHSFHNIIYWELYEWKNQNKFCNIKFKYCSTGSQGARCAPTYRPSATGPRLPRLPGFF